MNRNELLALVDGQCSCLQDEVVGKAVYGQPRKPVIFRIDQAQRVGVVHVWDCRTCRNGRCQLTTPEGVVDWLLHPGKQAYLDLAAPVEVAAC